MLSIFKIVTSTCIFEFKNEIRFFAEIKSDLFILTMKIGSVYFVTEDWFCQCPYDRHFSYMS